MNKNALPDEILRFLSGERKIRLPFEIATDQGTFQCIEVLRLLPARRIVLHATTEQGESVILKCYRNNTKGRREYNREKQGYKWVKQAGILTPEQLSVLHLDDINIIVYQYIFHQYQNEKYGQYEAMIRLMARLHERGLYQDDIHLDNLLLTENHAYLIDLASVKKTNKNGGLPETNSLDNLAKFIAQFTLSERHRLEALMPLYFELRDKPMTNKIEGELKKKILSAWQKRKRDYLSKSLRECSMTHYHRDINWEYASRRDFWDKFHPDSISEIETLFGRTNVDVLKAGNTATVIQTDIEGKKVVIKRYNIKNWRHAISRIWRPSRARQSWLNANLLEFIGLNTPKPLAFFEKRCGYFRSTAYFITDYVNANEIADYYSQRLPTENEVEQIQNIFGLLHAAKLGHHDMKAQNLLLDNSGQVFLIDLDAMKEYQSSKRFRKVSAKDKSRFLRNWKNNELLKVFSEALYSDKLK